MTCPSCGNGLSGHDAERGMCSYHATANGEEWHVSNRIMCNFIHRRIVPERLTEQQRDDTWAYSEGVA